MEVRSALRVVMNHTGNDAASELHRSYNQIREARDEAVRKMNYEHEMHLEYHQKWHDEIDAGWEVEENLREVTIELDKAKRNVRELRLRLWRALRQNTILKQKLKKRRQKKQRVQ